MCLTLILHQGFYIMSGSSCVCTSVDAGGRIRGTFYPQCLSLKEMTKILQYICQIGSDVTKNHQGLTSIEIDNKTVSMHMYETKTENCPVQSFVKYLSKRNPNCSALFQTPRNSVDEEDEVCYENRPLGKNRLGSMMVEISKRASTPITASERRPLVHLVMQALKLATSWHRNETSVKSYVRNTTSDKKRQMSSSISKLAISATTSTCTSTEQSELSL